MANREIVAAARLGSVEGVREAVKLEPGPDDVREAFRLAVEGPNPSEEVRLVLNDLVSSADAQAGVDRLLTKAVEDKDISGVLTAILNGASWSAFQDALEMVPLDPAIKALLEKNVSAAPRL